MNPDEAAAFGDLVRLGSAAIKSVLGAEHVYLFRINDKVKHLHAHLIPRYAGTPREYWGTKILEWPGRPTADFDEIKAISRKLTLPKADSCP